jgi:methyl-accepting chemotaxis protein
LFFWNYLLSLSFFKKYAIIKISMINQRKTSVAVIFTAVCLLIIVFIALSISLVFFINLRTITYRQIEANTQEIINRVQDKIVSMLDKQGELLHNAAFGIASLFKQGYIEPDAMSDYLKRVAARIPEITMLYYTNNRVWNQESGYATFSPHWTPPQDWNNTKRPWFIDAKQVPGYIAHTEYLDANTGELAISLSTVVFSERQEDLGVVAADILVTDLDVILKSNAVMPEQQIFLLNQEGLFVSHSDANAVMQKNFFTESKLEAYQQSVLSSPSFSKMDEHLFLYTSHIPHTNWIVVSTIPVSVVFSEVNSLLLKMVLISLGLLILASVISIVFTHTMLITPIREVKQVADSLAAMDFTVNIKQFRTDEIGDMQHALITIRDSLQKGINDIQQSHILKTIESSKRLNTVVFESFGAMESITTNMDTVDDKVKSQMHSVHRASESASDIFQQINSFEQTVHTQADSIAKSSAAIEQLVANINAIRSVVSGTTKTTNTLTKSSETGHKMLLKLTKELKHIEEQSMTLQSANKTIADIAGQTNILAMNAAIEAAHAGETGKGFAVVAGEIRKLAELSGKESGSISAEIKKMERGIEQIAKVSGETVGAMDVMFKEISAMSTSFMMVNRAVEEQAAGGEALLKALQTVDEMTEKVGEGTGLMHERSDSIHTEMINLKQLSEEVTRIVQEMRIASGSIASFLENAKELSQSGMTTERK